MFVKHIGYKFKILHSRDVCIVDSSSWSMDYFFFCFSGSNSMLVTGVILFIAVKLRTKKKVFAQQTRCYFRFYRNTTYTEMKSSRGLLPHVIPGPKICGPVTH